jgi:dihydrofolate reductase
VTRTGELRLDRPGRHWQRAEQAARGFTKLVTDVLGEPQIIIMGRVTYEEMAPYWPSADLPIAARMKALPKLVFSRTLAEPLAWNNARLATRDLAEEIVALKREPARPSRPPKRRHRPSRRSAPDTMVEPQCR